MGVPNKAVPSTSVQSCPLTFWLQLLGLAEAGLLWGQQVLKDSHQPVKRLPLWLGPAQLVAWFVFFTCV